jgi:hypothetical protein
MRERNPYMRHATSALYRVLIGSLLVGVMVVGAGWRGKVEAQGHTVPFIYNEQATVLLVNAMGVSHFIGGGSAQIAGFPAATSSFSGVLYPPAANHCQVYTASGTTTFTGNKGSFDWVNLATLCPVTGQPLHFAATGTVAVAEGTGILKGAIGGGTFKVQSTFIPPTQAGQPPMIKFTTTGTSGSVTLAS